MFDGFCDWKIMFESGFFLVLAGKYHKNEKEKVYWQFLCGLKAFYGFFYWHTCLSLAPTTKDCFALVFPHNFVVVLLEFI